MYLVHTQYLQVSADPGSEKGNYNEPCSEDEEFFSSRQDAETMEEAICNLMDGMEAQERGGLKDLHRFVGRLPVQTAKELEDMTHIEALEGGFLPEMDEDQQNRFTPSELKLYKHALEYRCQFGRGKPRLGGLTMIVETFNRKKAARCAFDKLGKHTRECRKGDIA